MNTNLEPLMVEQNSVLSVEQINALTGRGLDTAVAKAWGWEVRPVNEKGGCNLVLFQPSSEAYRHTQFLQEMYAWNAVPYFHVAKNTYARDLLIEGVEQFGGVQIDADMEEWANGGLFRCGFMGSYMTWFLPYEEAICRAFLYAAHGHGRQDEVLAESTTEGEVPAP